MASSSATGGPDTAAVERRRKRETEAFHEALQNYRRELKTPTIDRGPKRLYNIYTGELTEDTADKPYVIVSYIWNPGNLPQFPRTGEFTTEHFDEMLANATGIKDVAGEPIVTIDDKFNDRLSDVVIPDFAMYTEPGQREYFREVFSLLAAEAVLRNISFVWMDSLCIKQDSKADKAAEIKHMGTFFSGAVCCVAVCEMLRRKYTNSWEERGTDRQYRPDIYARFGVTKERITEDYRERWGMHDEVLGWAVGYHELRQWLFQEMHQAKEVVHRAGQIRIRTTAALDRAGAPHSTDEFPGMHWGSFPADLKERFLSYHHRRYQDNISGSLRLAHCSAQGTNARSESYLRLTMARGVAMPQDRVFSLLSLYSPAVRHAMPVRYDISLIACSTILMYLRTLDGEFVLGFGERAPELGRHLISDLPSWLPRYTCMTDSFHPQHTQGSRTTIKVHKGRELVVTGPYLVISETKRETYANTTVEFGTGQVEKLFLRMANPNYPADKWFNFNRQVELRPSTLLEYQAALDQVANAANAGFAVAVAISEVYGGVSAGVICMVVTVDGVRGETTTPAALGRKAGWAWMEDEAWTTPVVEGDLASWPVGTFVIQ